MNMKDYPFLSIGPQQSAISSRRDAVIAGDCAMTLAFHVLQKYVTQNTHHYNSFHLLDVIYPYHRNIYGLSRFFNKKYIVVNYLREASRISSPGGQIKILSWYILMSRYKISGRRFEISGRQKQSSPGGSDEKCWAEMSLQLRIGAQITRKYARNLFIDVYTINFNSIQH